ncbi:hypothetical protein [Streptomyces sp. PSKA30]|uniref:hypothetical protein n=1 Tax=Streptomyces sp. PSKA30 TaxID=2874597 RepID=UPI001CD111D7|nr:hypothetical protein [Streptomyces sp. PSKA30]MBZ9640592.1 hypothetical protein [Streptomyces sp. PSKA30]
MGTAELREAPADGAAARVREQRDTRAPDRDIPAGGPEPADRRAARQGREAADAGLSGEGRDAPAGMDTGATGYGRVAGSDEPDAAQGRSYYRPLWVEEPAKRRRLPDPVRTAAVRAVLIIAVTLIQAMVAFLCTMAGSWLAFPMVISSVVSTVVATWSVLDVWVTRQVWNQRNGVVSMPSSTARALRRERRRARRRARATERMQQRIRRRGGTGQLSHP